MRIAISFAATSAITLFTLGASAECEPACAEGFVCEEVPVPCTTIDVACVEGEPCEPVECEPTTESVCTPAPCTTSDDCGPDLVCLETETVTCTDAECPPGEECEAVEPQCETLTEGRCAPRWMAPCETAADCGEGFDCVEQESCSCSGSAPAPATDPDEADGGSEPVPAEEPECVCEPTGEKSCEAQEIDCTSDAAACPEGWTCIDNPNGMCTASTDGTTECFTDGPERLCAPPYYDLAVGGGTYAAREAGGEVANADETLGGDSWQDADGTDPETAAEESGVSGGGCALAPGGTTTSAWILSLLALVPLARRRRRA